LRDIAREDFVHWLPKLRLDLNGVIKFARQGGRQGPLDAMAALLELDGYEVRTACDGVHAL